MPTQAPTDVMPQAIALVTTYLHGPTPPDPETQQQMLALVDEMRGAGLINGELALLGIIQVVLGVISDHLGASDAIVWRTVCEKFLAPGMEAL